MEELLKEWETEDPKLEDEWKKSEENEEIPAVEDDFEVSAEMEEEAGPETQQEEDLTEEQQIETEQEAIISEREEEAAERSDDKSTFGEGRYDYIHRFSDEMKRNSKVREEDRMKAVLEAIDEYNRQMEAGSCPDGFPDEIILNSVCGEAKDKVVGACDAFLDDEQMSKNKEVARHVKKLKESVIEEAATLEDHIYAYLAKHPTSGRGDGVETDPSKALETHGRDEEAVNTGTADTTKREKGAELGDGRDPETMTFADIILAVESGEGGRLVQKDADAYRRSVEMTEKIKGNKVEERKRFFEVAKSLGAGSTVPMQMDMEGGAFAEKERTRFIDYRALTENQRYDEVDFSADALRQLTLVKSLGFLVGIADWQHIVDPEQLLYEKDQREVISIRIKEMQGLANVEGKMSRQEAERYVKQFDKGRDANTLKDLAANFGNQMMLRRLSGALGINPDALYARMETLFFCIKAFVRTGSIEMVPNKYFA